MTPIHKLYHRLRWTLGERRVLHENQNIDAMRSYMDKMQNPETLERKERLRWEQAENILDATVSRHGSAKTKEIWEDKTMRNAIIGFVAFREDGLFDWLPPAAQELAKRLNEELTEVAGILEKAKQRGSTSVDDYRDELTNAIQQVNAALEEFDSPLGETNDSRAGQPPLQLREETLAVLRAEPESREELEQKMFTLTDMANAVIGAQSPEDLAAVLAKFDGASEVISYDVIEDEATHTVARVTLKETIGITVADAGYAQLTLAEQKKAVLKNIQESARISLPENGLSTLRKAVEELDLALETLADEKKTILENTTYSKTRKEFLEKFTGSTEGVITLSINQNGQLDVAKLHLLLKGQLPDKTEQIAIDVLTKNAGLDTVGNLSIRPRNAELALEALHAYDATNAITLDAIPGIVFNVLTQGIENTTELSSLGANEKKAVLPRLLSAWNQEELNQYLVSLGIQSESSQLAPIPLYRRAMLSADVVDRMKLEGLGSMRTSTVAKLTALEIVDSTGKAKTEIDVKLATGIVEMCTDGSELDTAMLSEVVSFLFLNTTDTAGAAKQKADLYVKNLIESDGNIVSQVDGKFILEQDGKKKLITLLQQGVTFDIAAGTVATDSTKTFTINDSAQEYITLMRVNGVHENGFWKSTGLVFTEIGDTAVGTSTAWWEWIQNTPDFYLNADLDNQVLSVLNRQRALMVYKDTLVALQQRSLDGEVAMGHIITDLQSSQQTNQDIIGPLGTPTNVKEDFKQAKILLDAVTMAVSELEDTSTQWQNLPTNIRLSTLWLAMNKQGTGLNDAVQFIREYQQTPNAFTTLQNSIQFFAADTKAFSESIATGTQTKEGATAYVGQLEQYKAAILTYKVVSPLHPDIYNALLESISNVQKQVSEFPEDPAALPAWVAEYNAAVDVLTQANAAFMNAAATYEQTQRSPEAADQAFFEDFLAKHPDVYAYIKDYEQVTENRGLDNILSLYNDHQVTVKPLALIALANARGTPSEEVQAINNNGNERTEGYHLNAGSYSLDRWLIHGHREFSRAPLEVVLTGPEQAKQALIEAYVTRQPQTYQVVDAYGRPMMIEVTNDDGTVVQQPLLKTITPEYAFAKIAEVQRLLSYQSETHAPSLKQLEKDELFRNPIDRAIRSGIETLQDLWAGDAVDKGKVVVAIVAGIWLLKHVWNQGSQEDASPFMKLAKWTMVGLPLALVANSMYQRNTGRDKLGELLLYMPAKERNTALERWRRRTSEIDKYAFLGHESGHQAMRELMDENDPVTIHNLLQWRDRVKKNGYHDYKEGAPPNLDVSNIELYLGVDGGTDEGYEVAFLTFESLCNDISVQHGQHGPEWGADYLWREYVSLRSYDEDSNEYKAISNTNISMLDVIISESRIPLEGRNFAESRTFIEMGIDGSQAFYQWLGKNATKGLAQAKMWKMQAAQELPKLWERVYEGGTSAAGAAWDLLRVKGTLFWDDLSAESKAAWETFYNTVIGTGVIILEEGPRGAEWAIKKGTTLTVSTLQAVYVELDRHQITGDMLLMFEEFIERHTGGTMRELIVLSAKIPDDNERVAALAERGDWKRLFTEQMDLVAPIDLANPDTQLDNWILHFARQSGLIAATGDIAAFDKLVPHERMLVYERLKRRVYSMLIAERMRQVNLAGTVMNPESVFTLDWTEVEKPSTETQAIDNSFGYKTIALMALESTWTNDIKAWARQKRALDENWKATSGEITAWLLDWAQREDSTEYIEGTWEIYEDRFLNEARETLGEQSKEYDFYRAYIQTVFANVAIELAISGKEVASHSGSVDIKGDPRVLHLSIAEAKEMLAALKLLRASSPDFEKISNDKREKALELFSSTGAPPELPEIAAIPATPGQVAADTDADTLLKSIKKPEAIDDAQKSKLLNLLKTVSEAKKAEVRDMLMPNFSSEEGLRILQTNRESAPAQHKERVQYVINGIAATMLDDTVQNTLSKMSLQDLADPEKNKDVVATLLSLYKAVKSGEAYSSESEELADHISYFLEFALYQGKQKGKLDEYTNYLTSNGRDKNLAPSQSETFAGGFLNFGALDGAKRRFNRDVSPSSAEYVLTGYARKRLDLVKKLADLH